jgi:steroid delta-isomerase-like uncharacterized protein
MRNVKCVEATALSLTPGALDGADSSQGAHAVARGATALSPAKPTLAELEAQSVKAIIAALNAQDAKKLAALYTEDAVTQLAGMPLARGRAEIEKAHEALFDSFTGLIFWASRVWAKGHVVALEWGWSGTPVGALMGVKSSDKQAGALGLSLTVYTDDGLIAKETSYIDIAAATLAQFRGKACPIPAAVSRLDLHASKGTPQEDRNADVVKRVYAALDAKKERDFLAALADDVEYKDMTAPEALQGKSEAKRLFGIFTNALPDAELTVTSQFTADDFVITESTVTGTHEGQLGPFAATKKPVVLHSIAIVQMKDEKIVRAWSYANHHEFLTAIGVIEAPGAAAAGEPNKVTAGASGTDAHSAAARPGTGAANG